MQAIHLSIYALSIGAMFMAFCVVLISRTGVYKLPMVTFLGVYVLVMICDWLLILPGSAFTALWLFLMMGLSFLFAPCVILLANQISAKPIRLSSLDERLIILGWLLLLPLASSSYLNRSQLPVASEYYDVIIHTSMLLAVFVFLVQCYWASSRCLHLIQQRNHENSRLYAELNDPNIQALRILVSAVLAYAAICIVRVTYCAVFDEFNLVNFLIAVGQAVIAFGISTAVVLKLTSPVQAGETLRAELFTDDAKNTQSKYQNSGLTQERIEAVEQKLRSALDEQHAYLDSDLSLSSLCDLIDEAPHTVSQVISQTELQSFYTMVNERRLQAAMHALVSEPHKGILEIAFDCGFNSKSAFNACFKKQTGHTPSQFRKHSLQPAHST